MSMVERQRGHVEWLENHMSIHSAWNSWRHLGKILIFSPSSILLRQTEQSIGVLDADRTVIGRDWRRSGSSPRLTEEFRFGDWPVKARRSAARRRRSRRRRW